MDDLQYPTENMTTFGVKVANKVKTWHENWYQDASNESENFSSSNLTFLSSVTIDIVWQRILSAAAISRSKYRSHTETAVHNYNHLVIQLYIIHYTLYNIHYTSRDTVIHLQNTFLETFQPLLTTTTLDTITSHKVATCYDEERENSKLGLSSSSTG